MKEKHTVKTVISFVGIGNNHLDTFNKRNKLIYSFRVQSGGYLGVHYQTGEMEDEEGYARARQNLALKRSYPYTLETGRRSRNKMKRVLTDQQMQEIAGEALEHVHSQYPDFTLNGSFMQSVLYTKQQNDRGLDYEERDCTTDFSFPSNTGTAGNSATAGFP